MRNVRSHMLRGLFAAAVGTAVLCITVPAFADQTRVTAQAHDPLAGLTANQIAAKAAADLLAATSVHMSTVVTVKGTRNTLLDATYTRHSCAGSTDLTFVGATEHFIQIGKHEWVLLTKQVLAGAGYAKAAIVKYAGKWALDKGSSSPFGYITCGPPSLAGYPKTGWTEKAVGTVGGQHAVELSNNKVALDKKPTKATLWVSDSARPEFLKIGITGNGITFSHYNAKVTINPPPASKVVTLPPPPSSTKTTKRR